MFVIFLVNVYFTLKGLLVLFFYCIRNQEVSYFILFYFFSYFIA